MKKTNFSFILISFVMIFSFSFLSAQSWSVESKDSTSAMLVGPSSSSAKVSSNSDESVVLSDEDLAKITTALDTIWANTNLTSTYAMVFFNGSNASPQFRITVVPDSISYKANDLLTFLPSGLAFYYDSSLFYDIVVKTGDLLPRVTGAYISPDDMLYRVNDASKNPDRYMYDTALITRIERLESALMAVSKKSLFSSKLLPVDDEVVDQILSVYNEKPNSTRDDVSQTLKNRGIKVSNADINAVLMVYYGVYE